MKKRISSLYLLLSICCTGILKGDPKHNWQEFGDKWGDSKQIQNQKIDDNLTLYGKTISLTNVQLGKNFTCYGSVELIDTTVAGVATIYGPATTKDCVFKEIDIRCSNEKFGTKDIVQLTDTKVEKLLIKGDLHATKSSIGQITTFSSDITLKNSTVDSIIMMNNTETKHKKATIELIDTIIEGDIIFSQKGGTVKCTGTSEIKGRIEGGTLLK